MSELGDEIAREHRYLPDGWCTCGERTGRASTRGSFLPHAQHVAEVTEAAVRETAKFDPNSGDANAASPEDMAQWMSLMLMETEVILAPIREFAAGYKAKLIRDGWDSASAEAMAVQVHNSVVASAFAPK